MLTDAQREKIEEELVAISIQNPRPILVAGLSARLAGQLQEGLLPRQLVAAIIDLCIADGYTETPPALAAYLKKVIPNVEGVAAIVASLNNPPPDAPDPFEAIVLDNKLPFLGRKKMRGYLRALAQQNPPQSVVVVVGEQHGKTYTGDFVDFLRRKVGIRRCSISVAPGQGSSIGPQELARDILGAIGGDPDKITPPTTNLERWTQDTTNTILVAANKGPLGWWFILDGFNKTELRDDTRLLIVKFAVALNNGLAQQLHRLILIDFDRTILPLTPGLIALDKTEAIPLNAVRPAVVQMLAAQPNTDPDPFVAELVKGFPDPIIDLPELGERFRELADTLDA